MVVTVYLDKCNGVNSCPRKGLCIDVCALDAIEKTNASTIEITKECTKCGLCVMNCPNEALSK